MTSLARTAGAWLNAGLGFLYPEACQFCSEARATPAEGFVCTACRKSVRLLQEPLCRRCGLPFPGALTNSFECGNCRDLAWHFRYARSAVVARDLVLEAIHRYKYHRALWVEPFLADLLLSQASPALALEPWDWIVPVPLHFTKQREREFNQAERLARQLSRACSVPARTDLLKRVLPTETQTRLSREEREANVRNAFRLRQEQTLQGRRIVLVDDVFTTGATTNACAKVLRQAGASDVCVWTLARGV